MWFSIGHTHIMHITNKIAKLQNEKWQKLILKNQMN